MKMLDKEGLHPPSDLHADGPHLLTKEGCSARYMFTDLLYPPSHTPQLTCKDDTRSGGLRGRHSLAWGSQGTNVPFCNHRSQF